MSRIALCTLGIALAAGCGSKSGGGADLATPANADLSTAADDLSMTMTGDMVSISPCNNLTLSGTPTVPVSYAAMGAPAFSGGTLVDGTYFITSGTFYSGAGGMTGSYGTFRGVYRFSGATVDLLASTPQGIASETATVTKSGNDLTLAPTCGASGLSQELYSATSTSLSLGRITGSLGLLLTLTKQ
jgi:hypothetical protein